MYPVRPARRRGSCKTLRKFISEAQKAMITAIVCVTDHVAIKNFTELSITHKKVINAVPALRSRILPSHCVDKFLRKVCVTNGHSILSTKLKKLLISIITQSNSMWTTYFAPDVTLGSAYTSIEVTEHN